MKTFNAIVKVVTALAAITGAIYILATYGDKIVEWAKNMLNINTAAPVEPVPDEVAAEEPAEEVPASEEAVEVAEETEAVEVQPEEPTEEAQEDVPVADEADFEG